MAQLRLPRTQLSAGQVVELRREVRTGPVTGFPRGSKARVVGPGDRPGELEVELIGTGSVPFAFSVGGAGPRASVARDDVRRVYPPSPWWRRLFD